MQPLDAVYLQILKNLCTDLSDPVTLDRCGCCPPYTAWRKNTVRFRFFCHILRQQPQFSALKQQTKQMLLSYYQLEHFTQSHFFAPPCGEDSRAFS